MAAQTPPRRLSGALSTSRSSTPTQAQFSPPPGPPPPPPQPPVAAGNLKIAELQLIFPTVDVAVIELVLESCGGSVDRSIEQLLSMTDENFKPDELAAVRGEEASQVDLDEEFARSLVMQDREHADQRAINRAQRGGGGAGGGAGAGAGNDPFSSDQLPYQPRVRKAARPPNQAYNSQGNGTLEERYEPRTFSDTPNPPGMMALEDKVERFAEVGKQTLNTLFTRAKAKINEFQDAQAQRQAQQAGQSDWATGSGAGYGFGQNQNQQQQQQQQSRGSWSAPGGGRGGQARTVQTGGGLWNEEQAYEARSDTFSNSRSDSFSSQSTDAPTPLSTTFPTSAPRPAARASPARWQPSDAYDDPLPPARSLSGQRIDVVGGRRSPGVGSPEKAAAGRIDPAKLGILPKKRVDLLSTSPSTTEKSFGQTQPPLPAAGLGSSPQAQANRSSPIDDDDPNPSIPGASASLVSKIPQTPPATKGGFSLEDSDDDLEYTKNPFDER